MIKSVYAGYRYTYTVTTQVPLLTKRIIWKYAHFQINNMYMLLYYLSLIMGNITDFKSGCLDKMPMYVKCQAPYLSSNPIQY